jgi:hypothetical protein
MACHTLGCAGKIPEELWQAVVALRDRYPTLQLCRELHVSADTWRARLREAEAQPGSTTTVTDEASQQKKYSYL